MITVRDDADWASLVDAIGRPSWALDERYARAAGRAALADELDRQLGEWTGTLGAHQVMERLQRAGVPAAAVLEPADLLSDPHLLTRDFIQVIVQPGFDSILVEGDCHTAEHLPKKAPGPAPRQGQHTRSIARELLGLAPVEVDRLIDAGILEADGGEA